MHKVEKKTRLRGSRARCEDGAVRDLGAHAAHAADGPCDAAPIFVVVITLLLCSPPTLTLVQITSTGGSGGSFERLIHRRILWSYCVSTPVFMLGSVGWALVGGASGLDFWRVSGLGRFTGRSFYNFKSLDSNKAQRIDGEDG
ncbi:hypothetical protein CVT25_011501 [Psilocybe cyanescens]|uniref:Uncharacterized protein n=1 Tax=Psilocybe cyanescens TaxID=93625 RepID=A0A409XA85_PSICY|nr:hypothetical protein CVT25_011501 [Psilocybe cyanescens]